MRVNLIHQHNRANRIQTLVIALVMTSAIGVTVGCGDNGENGVNGGPEATMAESSATKPSDGAEVSVETTTPPTTVDPGTLSQTDDKPASSSSEVDRMGQLLWDAIVADDPSVALETFFPLAAYEQVKDIWNPESDWNNRLIAAFEADVASLYTQLGNSADQAVYLGIDIPGDQAQWIYPGGEYNKVGYWRVYGTTLDYAINGVEKSLPVYSLISWRGEWYVVHLGPIR